MPPGTWGEINFHRNPSGSYQAEARYAFFSGDTDKIRATGASRSAARTNLVLKLQGLNEFDGTGSVLTRTTTVAELARFWLDEKAVDGSVEPNTLVTYESVVTNHILPKIGARKIGECRASVIDKVLKDFAAGGNSTKRLRNALNQMFSLAVRHDAITVNPTRDAARIVRPKKEIVYLTVEQVHEVRRVIAAEMGRDRPGPKRSPLIRDLVDTMLGTGCRVGEVLALRWADVDLDSSAPTVTISGTVVTENGRGTYRKPRTKTDAGFRTLVLPPFVVDLLRRRRAECPTNKHGAIFATRTGTWQQRSNLSTQWNRVVDGTDYDWVTFHVFRRSVATHIDRTVNEDAASVQLGHANTDVTRTFYINKATEAPDLTEHLEAFRPVPQAEIDGAA
ncbi:MAG: Site-specific integrase [Marmoricola sp.]|nr:Site-specific integrase [Marmoricola sp.]